MKRINAKDIGVNPAVVNIGTCVFYAVRFTDDQLSSLNNEIKEIQTDFDKATPFNQSLFGHIEREYLLNKSKKEVSDVLLPHLINFNNNFNILESFDIANRELAIQLDSLWVNFQKKYEFNPPHSHSGVFSFVIWTKIPFNLEDELKLYKVTGKPNTSCFNFLYLGVGNTIKNYTIEVDKDSENVCIIFPSTMTHYVSPFYTSDDYRISVSGNFKLFVD
jgi:hypothetical protein